MGVKGEDKKRGGVASFSAFHRESLTLQTLHHLFESCPPFPVLHDLRLSPQCPGYSYVEVSSLRRHCTVSRIEEGGEGTSMKSIYNPLYLPSGRNLAAECHGDR